MRDTIKITTPDWEDFIIEYDQQSSPVPKELFEEIIERSIYKMFFKRTNLIKEVLCLREARFYLQKALFFIINKKSVSLILTDSVINIIHQGINKWLLQN